MAYGCATCDFHLCGKCIQHEHVSTLISIMRRCVECPLGHRLVTARPPKAELYDRQCQLCYAEIDEGDMAMNCQEAHEGLCKKYFELCMDCATDLESSLRLLVDRTRVDRAKTETEIRQLADQQQASGQQDGQLDAQLKYSQAWVQKFDDRLAKYKAIRDSIRSESDERRCRRADWHQVEQASASASTNANDDANADLSANADANANDNDQAGESIELAGPEICLGGRVRVVGSTLSCEGRAGEVVKVSMDAVRIVADGVDPQLDIPLTFVAVEPAVAPISDTRLPEAASTPCRRAKKLDKMTPQKVILPAARRQALSEASSRSSSNVSTREVWIPDRDSSTAQEYFIGRVAGVRTRDLRDECRAKGLPTSGKKDDLLDRLGKPREKTPAEEDEAQPEEGPAEPESQDAGGEKADEPQDAGGDQAGELQDAEGDHAGESPDAQGIGEPQEGELVAVQDLGDQAQEATPLQLSVGPASIAVHVTGEVIHRHVGLRSEDDDWYADLGADAGEWGEGWGADAQQDGPGNWYEDEPNPWQIGNVAREQHSEDECGDDGDDDDNSDSSSEYSDSTSDSSTPYWST